MAKDPNSVLLGLSNDARQDEIEARYQELGEFLRSEAVPPSLRRWAEEQSARIDDAYVALTSPDLKGPKAASAPRTKRADYAVVDEPDEDDFIDELDEDDEDRRERQRKTRQAQQRRAARGASDDDDDGLADEGTRLKQIAVGIAIGLVVLIGFFAVRQGWIPGFGSSQTSAVSQGQADTSAATQQRISQLKAQLSKSPDDQDALFELGELYLDAQQWQSSLDTFNKLVQLDPRNAHAWTDVGTNNFNLGQFDQAKVAWQKVLEIDPNDVQAHFNMGFLYSNVQPQDLPAALKEWEAVTKLAPNSDIAKTAQAHMDAFKKMLDQQPTTGSAPQR